MSMSVCLHFCMHITCAPGACGSQKKVSDPLALELQSWAPMWMLGMELKSFARAASTKKPSFQLLIN